jgi:hypothetical protein
MAFILQESCCRQKLNSKSGKKGIQFNSKNAMKKTLNSSSDLWKSRQPFESGHSLLGFAALDFYKEEDLNSLAVRLIDGYNPDRFDAMALRVFFQEKEPVITLYAVDKFHLDKDNYPADKLPVKKFRIPISFDQFLRSIKRLDFTLGNDHYDIADMLVINK